MCPPLIPNRWAGGWTQQPWDSGRAPAPGHEQCRGDLHRSFSDSLLLSEVEGFFRLTRLGRSLFRRLANKLSTIGSRLWKNKGAP